MKFVSFFVQPSEFFHLNQCWLFTQENLNKHKVTVYFSNCTSINEGKLVVAGYILLRAPMLTHRLHYLQSFVKNASSNHYAFSYPSTQT